MNQFDMKTIFQLEFQFMAPANRVLTLLPGRLLSREEINTNQQRDTSNLQL